MQGAQAIADHPFVGRFQKRKIRQIAQAQRLHLQDDGGEVGAQDFRFGELGPVQKIRFGIKPDAHPRTDATATAGALVGGGLRDVFYRQALQFAAMAVTADAGMTGINHRADARHGQRGFRHIGGQYDAALFMRLEYLLLLGIGQTRVQRQDFAIHRMVLAQGLGGFADVPFADQEN